MIVLNAVGKKVAIFDH